MRSSTAANNVFDATSVNQGKRCYMVALATRTGQYYDKLAGGKTQGRYMSLKKAKQISGQEKVSGKDLWKSERCRSRGDGRFATRHTNDQIAPRSHL